MRFPKLTFRPARRAAFAAPHDPAKTPKLILHVGSQKTGTTAIQFALSENRDHLAAARVWYPRIDAVFPVNPKLSRARAHFAFANAVADYAPSDRKRLARFIDSFHKRAPEVDRIILSAESMYRLTARAAPRPSPGANKQTALERRMLFLERLATVTAGFDPEVLLYLRRVDRFAASLYAESIVQTDKFWSFQEYLKSKGPRFGYRGQIDRFKMHFPVQVRSFEAASETGLLEAFCEHAGIPGELPIKAERRRPSVPNAAVLWLCRAKREGRNMAEVERNRRWFFALRPDTAELFQTHRRTVFWKDQAERDAFIEMHQSGVTEIAFPAAENGIAPQVGWTEAQHADAERRFHIWQAANKAGLRKRERARIPPYVLEE